MQPKTPKNARGRKSAPIPASPPAAASAKKAAPAALRHATHTDAIAAILTGYPDVVRSVRVLVVGASQRGKSTFARRLCAALERGKSWTIIHDQKYPDHAQYDGHKVTSIDDLRRALQGGHQTIICRAPITAEEAAAQVRDLAECQERATLLIDEPVPALRTNPATGEPMERVWMGPSLIWLCLQGGGLGASLIQLDQLPKMIPGSLIDQATAIVFFGTGGRSLSYSVDDLHLLPREAAEVVSGLAVGECCVFFPDQNWDHTIYGPS